MVVDYLIVGCGYTGATIAERIATQLNKKVLIVEKRNHIGGNAYDYTDEAGVLIHKYGPHLFHTNSEKVWRYLSQFTEWRPYFHHTMAYVEGQLVPIPFNINTVYQVFSPKYAKQVEEELVKTFGWGASIPIVKLLEYDSPVLKHISNYIYEHIYLHYTLKQWGLHPNELSNSVTSRVPIRINRDNRYFTDTYQAMPARGYTQLFEKMLAHPNIKLLLNTDYHEVADTISYERMVFTGPIDEYFDYLHGALPYRSLRFDLKTYPQEYFQSSAIVNYPNHHDFTRITEFKRIAGQTLPMTTVAYEYPQPYEPNVNLPYYPIPRDETKTMYKKYEAEAEKIKAKVLFAGRLADYVYYNMDQVVARALKVFESDIAGV